MKLLFIPGLLSTREIWGKLNLFRERFSASDADVTSFDSITAMADAVDGTVNKDDDYCVIGISMGGYVALELATRPLDWLKKLILINTSAKPVNPNSVPDRELAIELASTLGLREVLGLYPGICFYEYTQEMEKLEEQMAKTVGVEAYIKQQTAIINRASYVPKLDKIMAKTLIITSLDDAVLPFKDSLELHKGIDNSTLFSLRRCGHLPTLEKSDEIFSEVESFLR